MPKINVVDDEGRGRPIRVTVRKQKGRKAERILIRCGCCNERVELYPSKNPFCSEHNPSLCTIEIGGVIATVRQWRKVLGPLLGMIPG